MSWFSNIGSPLTAALNWFSQENTNQANYNQNNINREMADVQFRTRHQTEVADLQKAGLNPVLSAGGGGSSGIVPSSNPMQAPQISMPDIIAGLNFEETKKNNKAQRKVLKAEAELKEQERKILLPSEIKSDYLKDKYKEAVEVLKGISEDHTYGTYNKGPIKKNPKKEAERKKDREKAKQQRLPLNKLN